MEVNGQADLTPLIKTENKWRKETYVIKEFDSHAVKVVVVKWDKTVRFLKLKVDDLGDGKVSYKGLKMDAPDHGGEMEGDDDGDEHWNPAWSWCSIL